jgi:hypothetical protein
MSVRARTYAGLVALVLLAVALDRIGDGWSDVQFYAVAAGFLVVFIPIALLWTEMAPDGALRRRRPPA